MRRRSAGVTLLELLIAVSLLSLLSAGILTALRVGLNAMAKTNGRLMDNRRMGGVQRIVGEQIAGFIPVVAACLPAEGDQRRALPFFQGEPASMRFVSAYSLGEAWRGYPQILEYQVIPGEQGNGVRLVVNEHLYTGPETAGNFCLGTVFDASFGVQVPAFRPIAVGPRSFVLADRLAFCRFSFREERPRPEGERWVTRWIARAWPSAVRIEMGPLEQDASRIQPATITVPVRVNRQPGVEYADYY